MIIKSESERDAWQLTEIQLQQVRSGARFWTTRTLISKRSTICRACGGTIARGSRLRFSFLVIARRQYTYKGDLHIDLVACAAADLERRYLLGLELDVADYLADPSKYESYL
jgi:hypothetical protein